MGVPQGTSRVMSNMMNEVKEKNEGLLDMQQDKNQLDMVRLGDRLVITFIFLMIVVFTLSICPKEA